MRLIISLLFSLIFFFSCTKKEITIQQTNTTETIDGNVAPPFSGVTTIQIQNYINKIHIDLVGREPNQSQLENLSTYLKDNDLNEASRNQVMNDLMDSAEYFDRFWEIYSNNMLGGFTREDVDEQVLLMDYLIDLFTQQGDMLTVQFLELEKVRYLALQSAVPQLAAGEITLNVFLGRLLNNAVFEEINMGSENFVIASFENLFKRQPTNVELQNGTTMVDGLAAQLLFLDGISKADFIDIMTTVPEFHQGLTIDIYQTLLARRPDSQEMTAATLNLSDGANYQAIQRKVMNTKEYAGF